MDKLIEQALKKHKIVRYLDTFEEVMMTYKTLLKAEMEAKNISSNPVLADSKNCDYESSNGKWVFERSSGYAGYRCEKCATWIYENQKRKCNCDA